MIGQPPMLDAPNAGGGFRKPWVDWLSALWRYLGTLTESVSSLTESVSALKNSGPTASRPTANLWTGRPYFDATLNKPIWWNGAAWVDSTGTTV